MFPMHQDSDFADHPDTGAGYLKASRPSLGDALRKRTWPLHRQAEGGGIIFDILHGKASRLGYAMFLRNLLPAYLEMERGLERLQHAPGLGVLAQPVLYRSRALESDLAELCGSGWRRSVPLLHAGERYGRLVAIAAEGNGARLIAHAYVRYLGDLNGGQVLKNLLGRSLDLEPQQLSFYEFSAIPDMNGFKAQYRNALEDAAAELPEIESILNEAVAAFRLNMEVSEAVQAAALRAHVRPPHT
jgi:heme oxygenase